MDTSPDLASSSANHRLPYSPTPLLSDLERGILLDSRSPSLCKCHILQAQPPGTHPKHTRRRPWRTRTLRLRKTTMTMETSWGSSYRFPDRPMVLGRQTDKSGDVRAKVRCATVSSLSVWLTIDVLILPAFTLSITFSFLSSPSLSNLPKPLITRTL